LSITGQDGKEMVLVPAGEFLMGATDADHDARSDEKPQHVVTLDAFYIDRTEVTNAEFCRFLNEKGNQEEGGVTWLDVDGLGCRIVRSGGQYQPQNGYADHPVVYVTWYGARAYAQWAGKRLPTEAEWEKAARGTDGRIYPWGNAWNPARRANTRAGGPGQTTPVGQYSPEGDSPYGCADMAGNVQEWTSSVYDGRMDHRVLRGGSWWYSQFEFARCSSRSSTSTDLGGETIGFRCVRAADALETTP
jgi:formylglycine-generating enzyme required for sulfatase activity